MLPFILTSVVRKIQVKVKHFSDPEMLSKDHEDRGRERQLLVQPGVQQTD